MADTRISLVVLAAGIGSRYGGIKQMDPVGPSGEVILDYSAFDAIRAGFDRIVFVVSPAIEEAFRVRLGDRIGRHMEVRYVRQTLDAALPPGFTPPADRVKPWGTGHAVLCCRKAVDGPFAVINADDYYGVESLDRAARFLRETAAAPDRYAMVAFVLNRTLSEHGAVARGVCSVGSDGRLLGVVERTNIETRGDRIGFADGAGQWHEMTGDERVSMNLWGFKPSLFDRLDAGFRAFLAGRGREPKAEYFIPNRVNDLIAEGAVRVDVLDTPCAWFGVTYLSDKPRVEARLRDLISAGVYPPALWA